MTLVENAGFCMVRMLPLSQEVELKFSFIPERTYIEKSMILSKYG